MTKSHCVKHIDPAKPLLVFLFLMNMAFAVRAQNCDVDFPGTANILFSTACGSTPANVVLGKNTKFGNGDVLTFGSDVTISGNVTINAEGSGKIIIPANVDVNVVGNFNLNDNGGCTSGSPCVFEIVVTGTLHVSSNFKNDLTTIVWSGSGTVIFDDKFDNSNKGCMQCGSGGCPNFQGDLSGCKDSGSGCSQGDFCAAINVCDNDVTLPIITACPANISANITGSGCTQPVSWIPPAAQDNCTVSSFTSTHNPGFAFPTGITTVTYTAVDAKGNTATCSFTVTVIDNMAPLITACPANISANMTGSGCTQPVSWTPPTAQDNCSVTSFTSTHNPGFAFPKGITTVTYTAVDAIGNTATCSFTVTVIDNMGPQFTSCPTEIINPARPESCDAVVNWTVPTATDNCGSVNLTSTHNPGSTFQIGTTVVTYTAIDLIGNATSCQFNVVVTNENVPVISNCPKNITTHADEAGGVSVTWIEPTASVACNSVILESTHRPGDVFPVGETEVTYTANSSNGKTTTCKFMVKVSADIQFTIKPVVTPNGDGTNDYWELANIEKFGSNTVVVVDRWGSLIYKASGYNNDNVVWRGENRQGVIVPTGTYFYTISIDFLSEHVEKRGAVEVIR